MCIEFIEIVARVGIRSHRCLFSIVSSSMDSALADKLATQPLDLLAPPELPIDTEDRPTKKSRSELCTADGTSAPIEQPTSSSKIGEDQLTSILSNINMSMQAMTAVAKAINWLGETKSVVRRIQVSEVADQLDLTELEILHMEILQRGYIRWESLGKGGAPWSQNSGH